LWTYLCFVYTFMEAFVEIFVDPFVYCGHIGAHKFCVHKEVGQYRPHPQVLSPQSLSVDFRQVFTSPSYGYSRASAPRPLRFTIHDSRFTRALPIHYYLHTFTHNFTITLLIYSRFQALTRFLFTGEQSSLHIKPEPQAPKARPRSHSLERRPPYS
jgi:hypothetical protein